VLYLLRVHFVWVNDVEKICNVQNATVVANLGNAHRTPYFGPTPSYDDDTGMYVAMVVRVSPLNNKLDRWEMVVSDTVNAKTTVTVLSPFTMAITDSFSGIGF